MDFLLAVFIFTFILFLYIHIMYQLKKSEDLEIYEMDYISNENLQEVCDMKQPFLFEYRSICPEFFQEIQPDLLLSRFSSYDLKIKESDDYKNGDGGNESIVPILLPLGSSHSLMKSDTHSKYITENNEDFIEETGMTESFEMNGEYMKPSMTAQTKYDVCFGSNESTTPLRYHTGYRHFIPVFSGKIAVKMTPFKSQKYLYPIYDYENLEIRSPVDCWTPLPKYKNEMEKVKFLEFSVPNGSVLYIPPYWWYSIKYEDSLESLIGSITYNSVINIIVNIPNYVRYFIAQQTMEKGSLKRLSLEGEERGEVYNREPTNENKSEIEIDANDIGLKPIV
jgi:hypothetical protein